LGIWGDERETGKSAASDILSKKKTLPVVIALNHPGVGKRLRALYAGPQFAPEDVPAVLSLLDSAGARQATEHAVSEAAAHGHAVLQRLDSRGGASARELLAELLDMMVSRTS
jgi:geranylgeranyl diphosphate synthase type I